MLYFRLLKSYRPLTLIHFLFFLSGGIGLVAEIVWTRMLLLIFGSTVYSVATVLSTFMAGLALGSFVFGKLADRSTNTLKLYAWLELGTGVCTLGTIFFIPWIHDIYRWVYGFSSGAQVPLLTKVLLSSLTILPATFCMGGTLPTLLRYFTKRADELGERTSLLYAINTVGAASGTVAAGFVLIELLGLNKTLLLAAAGNFLIWAILFPRKTAEGRPPEVQPEGQALPLEAYSRAKLALAVVGFGLSGLLSMAYEVAWVRLLTPSTGTYIYAFSIILTLFLFGIAAGSFVCRPLLVKNRALLASFGLVEAGIGLCAVLTLFVFAHVTHLSAAPKVMLVIVPSTMLMGAAFPIVTALFASRGRVGHVVGGTYAANTIGSILGPLVAGFGLLPLFGTTKTILFTAAANLLLGALLIWNEREESFPRSVGAAVLGVSVAVFALGIYRSELFLERSLVDVLQALRRDNIPHVYMEDETASVLAYNHLQQKDAWLIVDGVATTGLSDLTKFMAHLPLFLHPHPENVLVIAFGMGTTFRSALSHGVRVDAVELVPSVLKAFPLFYPDARDVLQNPRAHVTINDGRNFLFLTKQKYDVITVDPPPPINSANTTILYSKEFYEQAKQALRTNGIFSQWMFFGEGNRQDVAMLTRSFTDVFPYVSVWRAPLDVGMYLVGSNHELPIDAKAIRAKYQSENVFKDVNEFRSVPYTLDEILAFYQGNKPILDGLTAGVLPVTDDRPRTEYFLLRRAFGPRQHFRSINDLLRRP